MIYKTSLFFSRQAAESGNLEDFNRLFLAEPERLNVRDSKGRAAAHQAAARNKINILQFIANHGGGKRYSCILFCTLDKIHNKAHYIIS